MKLSKVIKSSVVAIVAGIITNSIANLVFPKKEFSLFPTLSIMGTIIASRVFNYNLYKKLLVSNLVYTFICLVELRFGVSLISVPFFIATSSLVLGNANVNTSKELIAVSNFPRLEKLYSESKLRKKVNLFKEKVRSFDIKTIGEADINSIGQIIKTRKFVAYKEGKLVKLIYEYYENFPNIDTKSIAVMKNEEFNSELILNKIYERALSTLPPFVLFIGEMSIQIPSNYSKGKIVVIDQEGKINLQKTKKVNERNGWIELGNNSFINFVKKKLFSSKATFSINAEVRSKCNVELIVCIKNNFRENEISDTIISVPKHVEKLGDYLRLENLEKLNNNVIFLNRKDDFILLLGGDKNET